MLKVAVTLALGAVAISLAGCGGGGAARTSVHILAVNQNVGRAQFSFTCSPTSGDVPSPSSACAAVSASPGLLTNPKPFTCSGGMFSWWDITITGRFEGRTIYTFVSTCWTPQMRLIDKLGLDWEVLHAHLVPRREGHLIGGESKTFPDLRAGDLVTCDIHGRHLEEGVPTDTEGGVSSTGYGGKGVVTVTLKVALRNNLVRASCT